MVTPGSIFALNKATKNEKFSKAIADKYENAGTAPYAGVSLVFLNLKQNQILQRNTEETIRIICQLMLQWNNRQNFPLAKTTVFSHIRENIEHDLQILSCENKELYRELNFIWQGIRMLDRKEASAVDKKRAKRRQDYLQRERSKWDEKIEKNLTQIRQNAVQVPAVLRPVDVRNAIFHQLRQEQSLRIRQEQNLVFIYRDSFRELHRMLEHRLSDKTVLENRISGMELQLSGKTMQQPLPNETQKKARREQIPAEAQDASAGIRETRAGVSDTPAEIQTVDRVVNRLINQQISRQVNQRIDRQFNQQIDRQLQTEAPAHPITAIPDEGITEAKLPKKATPGTGTRGAKPFTGFIYRDSFRELYRMLEHRLPGKAALEHLLPGATQEMIPKTHDSAGVQEAPARNEVISAGIQIENHIVNQQINRQINQQINRQIDQQINRQTNRQIDQQINQQTNRQLMQIEEISHGITEIREAELSEAKILRTKTPMTGIIGIDPLRKDAETRLRSLGELFTGFIYHGSFRELHRKLEQRMPNKMIFENRLTDKMIPEHQLPDKPGKMMLEHRQSGETQKTIRQNQVSREVQETPAEIQKIFAGIQTLKLTGNRQMSQQIKQQVTQQMSQQIKQQVTQQISQQINEQVDRQLMQTEAHTRREEDNLFRQILVRDDDYLLKTIPERQRTNANISTVMTQTNGRRQFDIRQRDILTYNEAESLKGMLRHADPAMTGYPATAAAQILKTQAAEPVQPLKYLVKEQRAGKLSEQDVFLNPIRTELQYLIKKEAAEAEALREQKQNVKVLMEKINIQEQVIEQIKNARQGQNSAFGKAEVKMIADTVLERLYKDIHLQRLRMGMS